MIADGAGGLPGGRRASETAVTVLRSSLKQAFDGALLLRTAILNGIDAANQAVLDIANGSATTLTVVTIEGRIARMYQIGDSEAMIVGQRGLVKAQTTAHSPTGFAVEAGFLDQRDALRSYGHCPISFPNSQTQWFPTKVRGSALRTSIGGIKRTAGSHPPIEVRRVLPRGVPPIS